MQLTDFISVPKEDSLLLRRITVTVLMKLFGNVALHLELMVHITLLM